MRMQLSNLTSLLLLSSAAIGWSPVAIAQDNSYSTEAVVTVQSIPDAFERAFYQESGDIFANTSVRSQANVILGFGSLTRSSYPENQLLRDARRVENLYRTLLEQQISSDPIIRTPDLQNPYDTSLLSNPSLRSLIQGAGR